jgi:glyoxylase-like metal-dependent hydrolase (beta-lactamase superfamily II)
MEKKFVFAALLTLTLIITLMNANVFADDIPGWLESRWEPDPLQTGAEWWRDTANQNALAEYYYDVYPQIPYVETIAPGVYVVKGVGKSNVVALVGDSEWVLIDSQETPQLMQLSLLLLRPYTGTRRLKGLIYTSEEYTHYSGSSVVAPFYSIPVWASAEFFDSLMRISAVMGVFAPRSLKINGMMLPGDPNGRIGPVTTYGHFPFHVPNNLVSEETTLTLAGFNITLIPNTSASDAGLAVWLPDNKILISGDVWSPCFPDIGPLTRSSRSVKNWAATINSMLALTPDYLIPAHGPIAMSNAEAQDILTNYRDAMNYVHDRTIALLNTGLTAEDAAALIELPEPLASDPNLQQFIANIPSAVKGIAQYYVGWFNNEPPELASSLTTAKQAEIMVELAGGLDAMLDAAKQAELDANDLPGAEKALLMAWAAYRTDSNSILAARIYVQALRKNAYMQQSNPIRNYYLTTALMVEQNMPSDITPPNVVITAPENGAEYTSDNVPAAEYTVSDDFDPNPTVIADGWSDELGEHTMTVTATDASGNVGVASVTYSVIAMNTPPAAEDDNAITDEGNPVIINVLVNDSDADDDALTIIEVSQGINGSVTNNEDGTVTYAPNTGFFGTDSFTYAVSDGRGGTDTAAVTVTVNPLTIQVEIDIKPGSETNPINLGSNGVVPVAVLTNSQFDAGMVNPETVLFAGAAAKKWLLQDVDGDGDFDLLLHFDTEELDLTASSTEATLSGQTTDGHEITGTDAVRIVPAKNKK